MSISVLVKPVITEKSNKSSEREKNRIYTFRVERAANKLEIKNAVEALYNVKVESVSTTVVPGKKKVRSTKKGMAVGMKSPYKKAFVKVKDGETIDLYGTV